MRRIALLILLILPLFIWSMTGCNSSSPTGDVDTTGTGGGGLAAGDTSDPAYDAIEGAVGSVGDISGELLGLVDVMIDTLRGMPSWQGAPSASPSADTMDFDSFYVAFHANSNFWYFYASSVDTAWATDTNGVDYIADIMTTVVEDSLRFRQGSSYVQFPDTSQVNQITFGVLMTVSSESGMIDMTVSQRMFIDGGFFNDSTVTMDGTAAYDVAMSFFGCDFGFDMDLTITNVTFDMSSPSQECPSSGSLGLDGMSGITCTNGDSTVSESDYYSIEQTFNGTSVTIVAEDATTRWEVTESCVGGAASPNEPLYIRLADRMPNQ